MAHCSAFIHCCRVFNHRLSDISDLQGDTFAHTRKTSVVLKSDTLMSPCAADIANQSQHYPVDICSHVSCRDAATGTDLVCGVDELDPFVGHGQYDGWHFLHLFR